MNEQKMIPIEQAMQMSRQGRVLFNFYFDGEVVVEALTIVPVTGEDGVYEVPVMVLFRSGQIVGFATLKADAKEVLVINFESDDSGLEEQLKEFWTDLRLDLMSDSEAMANLISDLPNAYKVEV